MGGFDTMIEVADMRGMLRRVRPGKVSVAGSVGGS